MLIYVPLEQIDDNPFQERQDYTDVDELAGRIAAKLNDYPETFGLMQVPRGRAIWNGEVAAADQFEKQVAAPGKMLQLNAPDVRVQLAFGHRRARAFRHLHQTAVPGYEGAVMPIHVNDLADDQMLDAVWSENRERKDISAVEEARLLARKLERVRANGGSQRDVANEWGLARPTVANRLRLLELPEEIQTANQSGVLSERQCLALAPVVQMQQMLNGQSWDNLGHSWNRPKSPPAEYIQAVVADGSKATSDDIREYTRRVLNYTGKPIPKCIAKHEFELSGVRQSACKGCPRRINDTCLDDKCLAVKESGWIEHIVGVVSEELDVPASDREADFVTYKHEYDARGALRTAYEQKLAGNLVVGWSADGGGVRPYHDSDYCGSPFGNDGRAGIIIGTRGPLLPDVLDQVATLTGEAVEIDDIPDRAARDAWENEASQYLKDAGRVARQTLAGKLYLSLDTDVIQALMCHPNDDWIDDAESLVGKFVKFMWEKGRGIFTEYDAWLQFKAIEQLLNRAGLDANKVFTTGSPAGDLRWRAVMALAYWYRNRHYAHNWDMERKLNALTAVFAEFEAAGPWADEEMANLHYELGRAMDDVEKKMEKDTEDA